MVGRGLSAGRRLHTADDTPREGVYLEEGNKTVRFLIPFFGSAIYVNTSFLSVIACAAVRYKINRAKFSLTCQPQRDQCQKKWFFTPSAALLSLNGVRKFLVIFQNKNLIKTLKSYNRKKKCYIYTTHIIYLYSWVGDCEKKNSCHVLDSWYIVPIYTHNAQQGNTWDWLIIIGHLLLNIIR